MKKILFLIFLSLSPVFAYYVTFTGAPSGEIYLPVNDGTGRIIKFHSFNLSSTHSSIQATPGIANTFTLRGGNFVTGSITVNFYHSLTHPSNVNRYNLYKYSGTATPVGGCPAPKTFNP
jgi:hypothetical protein